MVENQHGREGDRHLLREEGQDERSERDPEPAAEISVPRRQNEDKQSRSALWQMMAIISLWHRVHREEERAEESRRRPLGRPRNGSSSSVKTPEEEQGGQGVQPRLTMR